MQPPLSAPPKASSLLSSEKDTWQAAEPITIPSVPSAPTRAVVIPDKSGSTHKNRVQQPTLDTLQPLLEQLIVTGGELIILPACNDSNYPALRETIPEPPLLAPEEIVHPIPPDQLDVSTKNPLYLPELHQEHAEAWRIYHQQHAEATAVVATHEKAVQAHAASARETLTAFSDRIAPVLIQPAQCQRTDLWGALYRTELILAEDNSAWRQPPHQVVFVISDGIDTEGKRPVQFSTNPTLYLINGNATTGIFADLEHHAFESLDAAIASFLRSDVFLGNDTP